MNGKLAMNFRFRAAQGVSAILRSGWWGTLTAAVLLLAPMVFFRDETVRLLAFVAKTAGPLTPLQFPILLYAVVGYRKLVREFRATPEPACHFLGFAVLYVDYLEGLALFNYTAALVGVNVSILLGHGIAGGVPAVVIALAHMLGLGFPLARLRLRIETALLNAEYSAAADAPKTASPDAAWRPAVSGGTSG